MKNKKKLFAALLFGAAVCAGAFAFGGCTGDNNEGNNGGTDITDPDVPLNPVVCAHENATHTDAYPATCTDNGNKEYWYCGECHKYFSDEAFTTETSLAAVTLVAGHTYGELIPEVPAGTCTNGVSAHYHCSGCEKDFNENKEEFTGLPAPIGTGSLIIKARHNILHVDEKEATCTEGGNDEYWQCRECDKYFIDELASMEADDPMTYGELGHNFEYEYNYETCKYVGVCANDEKHTDDKEAGVEGYPYLVKTADELNAALAKGGYIKLEADVSRDGSFVADSAVPIVLDLNGHTVSGSQMVVFYAGAEYDAVITIKNGNIAATAENGMAVYSYVASNVTLENVNIVEATYGVYAACGTFNLIGGTINASTGAVQVYSAKYQSVKPASKADYDVVINITDTIITSNKIGLNLRSAYVTVNNAEININTESESSTCVIAYRDCILEMNECKMTNRAGSGVQGNGTVREMSGDKFNYNCGINTDITLNNCTIEAFCGIYHPQAGGKLVVNGGSIVAANGTAMEVRGGTVLLKGATLTGASDEFVAEAENSGSTVKKGAAISVSQHNTDAAISVTVDGASKLTGCYALYEKDFQNTTKREIIEITIEDGATLAGYVYSQNCDNIQNTAGETPAAN